MQTQCPKYDARNYIGTSGVRKITAFFKPTLNRKMSFIGVYIFVIYRYAKIHWWNISFWNILFSYWEEKTLSISFCICIFIPFYIWPGIFNIMKSEQNYIAQCPVGGTIQNEDFYKVYLRPFHLLDFTMATRLCICVVTKT